MDDIDIYADLPSFSLDPEKNDKPCSCEELKKDLTSLMSKLENVQKIKENLENNLSSLLKTARAEIARKDKIIDDLRKRLDDTAFRRNNRNESTNLAAHRSDIAHQQQDDAIKKYENTPLVHSQDSETELYYDVCTNRKSQIKTKRISTVFGERLRKRIMEDERKNREQSALLKLSMEAKRAPEENVVESDKKSGSQSTTIINNDSNKSNIITQHSSLEILGTKISGKRAIENYDKLNNKRLRIEDNEDIVATGETDVDRITRHDSTDDLARLEDRLNIGHSSKNQETSHDMRHRDASETHRDAKPSRDYKNGWRKEERIISARDYDDSCTWNRNSRAASTSRQISEEHNGDRRRRDYRYNSLRRSYSRSRSDHESPSGRRLRETSRRIHRDDKYDDQRRNDGFRRNYEKNGRWTKHRDRERDDSREKRGRSSSDIEDGEKKRESRRTNKTRQRKSHESDKVAIKINSRASSSRTVVSTVANSNIGKNSCDIIYVNSTENVSKHVETSDSINLEEGEILDSPEKENNFSRILDKVKENDVKIVQNTIITTKKLEERADINAKTIVPTSRSLRTDSQNKETKWSSSSKNNEMGNDKVNDDMCKSFFNDDFVRSAIHDIGMIEQVCDNNIDVDGRLENLSSEIKKVVDSNINDISKIKKTGNLSIEDAIKVAEINNFDNNYNEGIQDEESKNSATKVIAKIEAVLNCDIGDKDKSQTPIRSKMLDENKMNRSCLSDHNYVQSPPVKLSDAVSKPSECREVMTETTTSTESMAKEIVNDQSVVVTKTILCPKNRKYQQNKEIVISRRRKAVTLSDSNASMTILMNTNVTDSNHCQ